MPDPLPGDPDRTAGASSSPPRPSGVPARVGRYEVRRVLGAGAFGRVYLAHDRELDREVAIKMPLAADLPPELRERFVREARATARIRHPNVCSILDVGTDHDVPFLVMEFIPGGTLADVLARRRGPYPGRDAAAIVRKLALGVAAAHGQGVLHRDLKPANVLWDEANREVLVTDFGLARVADAVRLSTSGSAVGTPLYMSPEQWRGRSADIGERSDVYSLGVMLYELATGALPYDGETTFDLMVKVTVDPGGPRPPSEVRPGLDPRIDDLCAKAMAKDPAARYPSARALADALADFLQGREPTAGSTGSWPVVLPGTAEWEVRRDSGSGRRDTVGSSPLHDTVRPVAPTADPGGRPAPPATKAVLFGCLLAAVVLGVGGVALRSRPASPRGAAQEPLPPNPTAGEVYTLRVGRPEVDMAFCWVPPGEFPTGGGAGDNPVRRVAVTKGFWMGRTEVTQAQWRAVTGTNPSGFKGDDRPVEKVSWNDAQAFCAALAAAPKGLPDGVTVRLPTEAEWEHACRAGTTTAYWSGDGEAALKKAGWYGDPKGGGTHPVKRLAPNPWGLYDVHGNVWEWCQDEFDSPTPEPQGKPRKKANKPSRVYRGGYWGSDPESCLAAHRGGSGPGASDISLGLRVCFSPD